MNGEGRVYGRTSIRLERAYVYLHLHRAASNMDSLLLTRLDEQSVRKDAKNSSLKRRSEIPS